MDHKNSAFFETDVYSKVINVHLGVTELGQNSNCWKLFKDIFFVQDTFPRVSYLIFRASNDFMTDYVGNKTFNTEKCNYFSFREKYVTFKKRPILTLINNILVGQNVWKLDFLEKSRTKNEYILMY
jgi:hypothetical protein